MTPPPQFFLDRPVARVLAFCVFLACAGALAYLHRADLWPSESSQADADDPFARCFAERAADVDRMLAEGVIQEDQAALFKTRAEAMCRATTTSESGAPSGDGGPGLPLPAQ